MQPQPRVLYHEGMYLEIAFSSDGRLLAATSVEPTGEPSRGVVWEARTGQVLCRIEDAALSSPVFSPSGNVLATGAGDGVRLWDSLTGTVVRVVCEGRGRRYRISGLAFSPDGGTLGAAAEGGFAGAHVLTVDASTGRELRRFLTWDGEDRYVAGLGFSADGTCLTGTGHAYDINDRVYAWSAADGTLLTRFAALDDAYRLDYVEGLRWVATSEPSEATPVWLWRGQPSPDGLPTNWDLAQRLDPPLGVWDLLFSPDERVLAAMGGQSFESDGEGEDVCCVRLWDPDVGALRAQVELPGHAYCMAFSPDSNFLVTMRGECEFFRDDVEEYLLEVWDAKTGRPRGRFPTASRRTNLLYHSPEHMRFSPDGSWLAVSHLHQVELWDTRQVLM